MFLHFKTNSFQLIPTGLFKGAVSDSGERLLTFERNSKTNTPLPSVLLQKLRLPNSWVRTAEVNDAFLDLCGHKTLCKPSTDKYRDITTQQVM